MTVTDFDEMTILTSIDIIIHLGLQGPFLALALSMAGLALLAWVLSPRTLSMPDEEPDWREPCR